MSKPPDDRRRMHELSRRSFAWAGVAALGGAAGLRWLNTRSGRGERPWPLRMGLEANEQLWRALYQPARRSREFAASQVEPLRMNGEEGLTGANPTADGYQVELRPPGGAPPVRLSLADLQALGSHDQIVELRCVEGWSRVWRWTGCRLSDLLARYAPDAAAATYTAMSTPDGGYYVGLDTASVLHPQSLLCWAMNGQPLLPENGAPLRLCMPCKYGYKQLKRVGRIEFGEERPPDYWAERGYDWYAGL